MDDFFDLMPGERVIADGQAAKIKGQFGGRWGPLILTNQRVLWQEAGWIWPLKRQRKILQLSDVASAHQTGFLDFIFGGKRLEIRLRSGNRVKLWTDSSPEQWVADIERAVHGSA